MFRRVIVTLLASLLAAVPFTAGAAGTPIKIGVLAFGTLNWEIAVIKDEGLDKAHGFSLETVPLASPEAGKIGLQGGSLDLAVGDWIWVAKQREQGIDFSFVPYSSSHGALVVPKDSPIRGLADLKGKRLGIAGGGLDKNWLLLRALAQKQEGLDLDKAVEKTFGAPPLLNEELQQGKLDAVLNYWNYAAKLVAKGYRQIVDGRGILRGLGIEAEVPALGYVFREAYGKAHGAELAGFFKAAAEAKQRICASDAVWAKVAPLTQEADAAVGEALRKQYCAGRVADFGEAGRKAAGEVYALIGTTAGGKAAALPAGVFWPSAATQ